MRHTHGPHLNLSRYNHLCACCAAATVEAGSAEVAERGRGDDMAALEAAADAAGGMRLSGFVSAGVIQQQAPGDAAPAAPGALRAHAWHCCCFPL